MRPNDERLLLALAHGYQEQARNAEATRIVENLLADRPDSVEAHIEAARLALRGNRPDDAERKLRRANPASHPRRRSEFPFASGVCKRKRRRIQTFIVTSMKTPCDRPR